MKRIYLLCSIMLMAGVLQTDVCTANELSDFKMEEVVLRSSAWYDQAVLELKSEGVIKYTDELDLLLTRGRMAEILANSGLFGARYYTINPFVDMNLGNEAYSTYYNDILKLYWNGIFKGEADDAGNLYAKFDSTLTREQAVTFIVRAFGLVSYDNSDVNFVDSNDISGYAKESVEICCSLGVINGYRYPDKTFKPKNEVIKAEFLVMVYNAINLPEDNVQPNTVVKSTFEDKYRCAYIYCETDRGTYKYGDEIIIRCVNLGTIAYSYGKEFQLEMQVDDEWIVIPVNMDIDDYAKILGTERENEIKINFWNVVDELSAGRYRVIYKVNPYMIVDRKNVRDNFDKEYMSVEFNVY